MRGDSLLVFAAAPEYSDGVRAIAGANGDGACRFGVEAARGIGRVAPGGS